ncbi:hypothetical protein PoB_003520700 [Plakobranchus ocellatus]|uniref:Uncharacterized protein n=1 Tax=Plakobranchus ocellatus TaxID=259542 RepID=A0AAV4AP43_9GAST|nr:hypothetical protein PoB_003520700 [Plakobranchus ocellatus]
MQCQPPQDASDDHHSSGVHEKEMESLQLLIKAYSKLFTKLESSPCPGAEQQLEKFERILDKLRTCQDKEQVKLKARSGRGHALKTFQARAARLQQRRELMKQAELMHRQLKKRLSKLGYKEVNVENFQQLPHRNNLTNLKTAAHEASQISTEQEIDKQPVNEPISESFVAPDNRRGNQTMKHFKELEGDVKSQNHVQKYSPKSFQSQHNVRLRPNIDSAIGTAMVDAAHSTLEPSSLNEKQVSFHKSKVSATVLSDKKSKSVFSPPSKVIRSCPATMQKKQTQTGTANPSFVPAEQTGLVRGETEHAGHENLFKNSGLRALTGTEITEGRVRNLIQVGRDVGNGVTVNDEHNVFQETTCSQQMDVVYTNDALSNARVGKDKTILPNSHETESRVNVNFTPLAPSNTRSIPTNGFVPNTTLDLTTTNSQRLENTEIAADSNTVFLSKNSEIMQSQMVRQHNQQNLPTQANVCSKASINTCSKPLMTNFSENPTQQNYYTIVDTGGGQLSLVPVSQDTILKQHMNSSEGNEYPNSITENHLLLREANRSFTRKPNIASSPYLLNTASAQECFSNSDCGKPLGKLRPAQTEAEQRICGKVDVVTVAAGAHNGLGEAMSVAPAVALFKTSNKNGFVSDRPPMYVQNSSSCQSRPQYGKVMTTPSFQSEMFEQRVGETATAAPALTVTPATATVSESLNPNYIRAHVLQSQYMLNRPIVTSHSTAVNSSTVPEPYNQQNDQRILSACTASQLQHSQHLAIAEQTTRLCIPPQNMTQDFEAAMVGNDAPNGIATRDVGCQFNLCTTTEDLYCQPSGSQVRQNPISSSYSFTQTSKNGSRIKEAWNQKHQVSQAMFLNSHCNVSSQSIKKSKSSTYAQTSLKPEQKPKGRGRKRKKAANSNENSQGHIVDYFAKLAVPPVTEPVATATTTPLVSNNVAPLRLAQFHMPCHASESSLASRTVKANFGTGVGYKNKQFVPLTENPQPTLARYPVTLGFEPSSCTTKANVEKGATHADIALPEMLASKTHGNPFTLSQKEISESRVGTVLTERFSSHEDSPPNCNDTIASNKPVLETAPDLSKCPKMIKFKTVCLIDDAEWFCAASEFKEFWSESFSQIRMTEDFWQTVDMW